MTILRKELIVWMVFFLVVASSSGYYIEHMENEHEGIIRLHVIANSDSKADQALKLKVRDGILEYLEGKKTIDETREYINENIEEIEKVAFNIVEENGYTYPVHGKLKVTYIPEKSYEDLTLPAGNYETLNVKIGTGKGHNWWCVVFPQLCLIGKKNGKEKLVLKSKVKELINHKSNCSKEETNFL